MGCNVPLVEPYAVPDDYVSGITSIELLGNTNCRLVLYVEHTPRNGSRERVVVRKTVVALTDLPKITRKLLKFMARHDVALNDQDCMRALNG